MSRRPRKPKVLKVVERDPKDDIILACAVGAKARYLISRDPHLLDLKNYKRITILSPEDFIAILRAQKGWLPDRA